MQLNFREFSDQITCDSSKKICMTSDCDDCKHLIDDFAPTSPAATVSYQQWQNTDKFEKININGTVMDAFTELKKTAERFLIHTFVKRKQSSTHGYFDSEV